MAHNDDITDELFGDGLQQSIEKADLEGQWRDPAAAFVDPKLEEIKKQLAEPPRQSYKERRLQDLQRQARATPAPTELFSETGSSTAGDAWQDTVVPPPTAQPPLAPVTVDFLHRNAVKSPFASYLFSVMAALLVFTVVTAVHAAMTGWRGDLVVRGLFAGIVAGISWRLLEAGRFRATVIGLATHVIAFGTTTRIGTNVELLAIFCSGLVALLGSVVVGLAREANDQHRPLRT